MNFDLGPQEIALRDAVGDLCRGRAPLERLREQGGRLDRDLWRALGEAGVFSLRLPEPDGVGLGMTEAVLVFEALGRALIPGPLVATHLAAAWIDGAATGESIVGCVDGREETFLIEHLEDLDELVVLHEGELARSNVDEIQGMPVARSLDPLSPLTDIFRVNTIDVEDAPRFDQWVRDGAVLTAAVLVGIADAVTGLAVSYASQRKQFGRVIGSFQAVKHLCADMVTRTEIARASVYAAGCVLDDPSSGDADRAAAGAKLLAADAAQQNGKTAVQVHGGMGFTWEIDVHLYLKRAAVLATHFGTSDEKAEAVAACL